MAKNIELCATDHLAERPVESELLTIITSSPEPVRSGLYTFWRHRHLVYLFVWRDLRARYKQTLLGALWSILQPLLTMAVFSFVFRRIAKIPTDGVPYPVFVLCGLLPWQFFSQAVTRSSNSLVSERYLLTRVFVPRLVLPVSAVLSGLPDFAVAFCAAMALIVGYGVIPTVAVLMVLPFLLLASSIALCLGLLLSPLNARYRDVSYLVPFCIQLWFFVSPIAYPSTLVPEKFRLFYFLNPMTAVVDGFRWAITGRTPLAANAVMSATGTVCLGLLLVVFHFARMDRSFADVV